MRLHTSKVTYRDLQSAASVAQARLDHSDEHRSTVRDRAFEVKLVGGFEVHSARRPNSGHWGSDGSVYAATWDQWGVFLRHLYEIDPMMVCGSPSRPTYASLIPFTLHTDGRFKVNAAGAAMWPRDEHGDHRWQPGTAPRTRECTKCTARQIFPV
jgi:hypothetical protein